MGWPKNEGNGDALSKITAKYAAMNKHVLLKHLSQDCRNKLDKAEGAIVVAMEDDPTYKVMSNK